MRLKKSREHGREYCGHYRCAGKKCALDRSKPKPEALKRDWDREQSLTARFFTAIEAGNYRDAYDVYDDPGNMLRAWSDCSKERKLELVEMNRAFLNDSPFALDLFFYNERDRDVRGILEEIKTSLGAWWLKY